MWWLDFQKRRLASPWLMKSIYDGTKQAETDCADIDKEQVDAVWVEVHKRNAKETRQHAEDYKGACCHLLF